jgi:DNA-binding HxlR family transcriptional regulator
LQNASYYFQFGCKIATIAEVAKSYNQYCPVARALELVGERWSLLIVRELLEHGPQRYSDLHCRLEHCGTNILAARLKDLEGGGVIQRRRLPPPAASTVYELTEYGQGLQPVLHQLAHWGARSLGPPRSEDVLEPGWLSGALRMALPQTATDAHIEFRIGAELASLDHGIVREGPSTRPDAVVESDPAGFFRLLVDRRLDAVTVRGSKTAVRRLLDALPPQGPYPAPGAGELAAVSQEPLTQ